MVSGSLSSEAGGAFDQPGNDSDVIGWFAELA
jgi:hypothetical protein